MPDDEVTSQEPREQTPPPSRKRASIFSDPVVRWLAIGAGVLVVLYLVALLSAMLMGFFNPTAPRTRAERDLRFFELSAMQTPEDPEIWRSYINSLIVTRQYLKAQDVIDQASGVIDQTATQDILMSQAELYSATGKHEAAIKAADEVRGNLKKYYAQAVKKRDSAEMKGEPINENFWTALLIKAESQVELGDTKAALKALDEYIEGKPTAADVLVRRADLLAETGDKKGAERDYRAALKFIPDDEAALAGLEKIGAE